MTKDIRNRLVAVLADIDELIEKWERQSVHIEAAQAGTAAELSARLLHAYDIKVKILDSLADSNFIR